MIIIEKLNSKHVELKKKYFNIFNIPKIQKVVINSGISALIKQDNKNLSVIKTDLEKILGQKVNVIKSKRSSDNFGIKKGDIVSVMATLRGKKMYHFLEKVIYLVLPQTLSFNGFSYSSFDKDGNFSFGINDYTFFYEIDKKTSPLYNFGFHITINVKSKTKEDAIYLFELLDFPFKK